MDVTRILILTSDAGSGHRSAAIALESAFKLRYGEQCRITVVNPFHLRGAPAILRKAERTYLKQIAHTPALYQLQYEATDSRLLANLVKLSAAVLLQETMADLLTVQPADMLVSVYPLFGKTLSQVLKERCLRIPSVTVVTDLVTVHTSWFEPSVSLCMVPTDAVSEKALQNGMNESQVKVTGIPVHPRLAQRPADRGALRRSLGWDEERPTALVLGGGSGVGKIADIAQEIARRCPQAQMAVVAGSNDPLRQQLVDTDWPVPTHVYGFTNQMPALMHAADVLVTKAGGLSVSEGLACGLPLVIHQVIPGQEEGNLVYVQTRDAGVYAPTPAQVGDVLARWLQPGNEDLAYFASNAREAGHPWAADRVARLAWKLCHE